MPVRTKARTQAGVELRVISTSIAWRTSAVPTREEAAGYQSTRTCLEGCSCTMSGESWISSSGFRADSCGGTLGRVNRVRVTVDDLRRAVETDIRRNWSDVAWGRWLEAAAVLRDQSFRNVVLIKLQMPSATWVDGRPGWQRRGRHVVQGAPGIRIVAATSEVDRSAGPVQGHGVATVWDVSQTDGRSFGVVPACPPDVAFAALREVAVAGGYSVERGPLPSDADGAETADRRRRIVVADDLDVPMAAMSLAHELAHLRMHKGFHGASCRGAVRLEATSAAYLVLSRLRCLPDQSSADLIARTTGVVSRTPPVRLIETLGGRVVAAANRLYDAAERHLPPPHLHPAKPTLLADASEGLRSRTPGHPDPGSDRGPTP
ncbi:hypothetical protein JOF29_007306 [Kribbella aluminosa]|uniref:ImmA/IrrE family metallo-endopeptidase n=1 Tax=Kribbella aluminosa TaxID=416017 RepID=A0ABS4UX48_9ACTN|nr:hypothetical protein [Kribbella aluminosa]